MFEKVKAILSEQLNIKGDKILKRIEKIIIGTFNFEKSLMREIKVIKVLTFGMMIIVI